MYFVFNDLCLGKFTLMRPLLVICCLIAIFFREKLAEVLPGPLEGIPRREVLIGWVAWIYLLYSVVIVVLKYWGFLPLADRSC